jgi:hypothetical protein
MKQTADQKLIARALGIFDERNLDSAVRDALFNVKKIDSDSRAQLIRHLKDFDQGKADLVRFAAMLKHIAHIYGRERHVSSDLDEKTAKRTYDRGQMSPLPVNSYILPRFDMPEPLTGRREFEREVERHGPKTQRVTQSTLRRSSRNRGRG